MGARGECQADVSRREVTAVGLGFLATSVYAQPAHAIFGFGGPSKDEIYQRETVLIQLSEAFFFNECWKARVFYAILHNTLCRSLCH